ncbi:hypothetical protein [Halorubellus sp. PRR65]|uniref:hypothetical protein n=1 Tax=Halorubellus sp. PRR65 TaxID=3098148 RepID=UPI002B261892|nr:hypothetical protein [Halorubellus sp. PRR65]
MPKAIVHKQILDVAEDRPDDSIEELAENVTGASPSLVERVLEDYGDPSASPDETVGSSGDASAAASDGSGLTMPPASDADEDATTATPAGWNDDGLDVDDDDDGPDANAANGGADADVPEAETDVDATADDGKVGETNADDTAPDRVEALTDRQREYLAAIRARPDATQSEIAASFDVSQATVSTQLNAIDDFDWANRESYVAELALDEPAPSEDQVTTDNAESTPETRESAPDEDATVSESAESTPSSPATSDVVASDPDRADADVERPGALAASETVTEGVNDGAAETSAEPDVEPAEEPSTSESTDVDRAVATALAETQPTRSPDDDRTDVGALADAVDDLAATVGGLEQCVEDTAREGPTTDSPLQDTELAAKVIHATVRSDTIDETDTLAAIERLTTHDEE